MSRRDDHGSQSGEGSDADTSSCRPSQSPSLCALTVPSTADSPPSIADDKLLTFSLLGADAKGLDGSDAQLVAKALCSLFQHS